MTNSEHNLATIEMPHDRDFYAKRDELMAHAAQYFHGVRLWARSFHTDMQELGYELEYLEALTILTEAQQSGLSPIELRRRRYEQEDRMIEENKAWAQYAPWNQEERI